MINRQNIVANVNGDLKNMEIKDLSVDGSLFLESNSTDRMPFAISGQSLKLIPQDKELYRVTVEGRSGRLAKFKSKGIELAGNNLQLDQAANTIWVQGEGDLDISAAASTDVGDDEQSTKLENAKVSWIGGMVFDGSRIYFEQGVELVADRQPNEEGNRGTVTANSEALTIELTESIRFEEIEDQNDRRQTEPDIRRLVFVNNVAQNSRAFKLASHSTNETTANNIVAFQNATVDRNGNIFEVQKLFVPMATFDTVTGDVVTSGPGQALAYQFSDGNSRLSGFKANKSSPPKSKQELTCVHARFDGQLVANSKNGTMDIDRNTRSTWAKVDRFDQTLDPDRPDLLPLGAAVLKADTLKFAQWTPRNSAPRQEMKAEGNASIQSELFEAVADRMTYDDSSDILIVEGKPPSYASLSYRRSANTKADTMQARKVMYRLSDHWHEEIDVRSVEAGIGRE